MLYYDKIDISAGLDVNKISSSRECGICYYQYFLKEGFMSQPYVCNGCNDLLMMSISLNGIAFLNIHGVDYRRNIYEFGKSDAVNLLQNADLTEKRELL